MSGLVLGLLPQALFAQITPQTPPSAVPAIQQAAQMRAFPDPNATPQPAAKPAAPAPAPAPPPPPAPAVTTPITTIVPLPAVLGAAQSFADPSGQTETLVGTAPVTVATQPYFQSLGTNGRTCATCHSDQSNWSLTPSLISARFSASGGTDPLFRRFDGAVCPTADVSTPAALQTAYSLLLARGLIRVGLAIPSGAEFSIPTVTDPYNCTTSPTTGLTSPTSGIVSVYRRPQPTANLRFETVLMWDGREANLTQQAIDATLIHAQAFSAPTSAQLSQIVGFEQSLTSAQSSDAQALALNAGGAAGGPTALASQVAAGPARVPNPSNVFSLYSSWAGLTGNDATTLARQSIARGEQIFNTRPIAITGVAGFNNATIAGVAVGATVQGACSSCHNQTNVGNNAQGLMLDIGVTGINPPGLGATALPQFTLQCNSGSQAGRRVTVNDPGMALISGKCADIGKTKVPALRGLAARAPYFNGGQAAQLRDVVAFYNGRFNLRLSQQEQTDLVNFLGSL
jgi:hypothetical protein